MPTTVTIDRVTYEVEKLDDGTIRVTFDNGQLHPMQGNATDGAHEFRVHPAQTRWYAYWNEKLPQDKRQPGAADDEIPWWSSRGWKKTKPGHE